MDTLGKTIREIRRRKDWTQQELAARTGLDQSYLSRLEHDRHKNIAASSLARIATALEIDVRILYEGAGWLKREIPVRRKAVLSPSEEALIAALHTVPVPSFRETLIKRLIDLVLTIGPTCNMQSQLDGGSVSDSPD